jgi:hypothetical protein
LLTRIELYLRIGISSADKTGLDHFGKSYQIDMKYRLESYRYMRGDSRRNIELYHISKLCSRIALSLSIGTNQCSFYFRIYLLHMRLELYRNAFDYRISLKNCNFLIKIFFATLIFFYLQKEKTFFLLIEPDKLIKWKL